MPMPCHAMQLASGLQKETAYPLINLQRPRSVTTTAMLFAQIDLFYDFSFAGDCCRGRTEGVEGAERSSKRHRGKLLGAAGEDNMIGLISLGGV
jgi:hypothetical protein